MSGFREMMFAHPLGATIGGCVAMILFGAAFVVTAYMLFGSKGDEE